MGLDISRIESSPESTHVAGGYDMYELIDGIGYVSESTTITMDAEAIEEALAEKELDDEQIEFLTDQLAYMYATGDTCLDFEVW